MVYFSDVGFFQVVASGPQGNLVFGKTFRVLVCNFKCVFSTHFIHFDKVIIIFDITILAWKNTVETPTSIIRPNPRSATHDC